MADNSVNTNSNVNYGSGFRIYAIGIVAEDIKEDDLFVDVYPQETIPVDDGVVKKIEEQSISTKDVYDKVVKAGVNKTNRINCKWLPYGNSNRLYPPNVCKGELVIIYRYGDTDKYYWVTFGNEIGLRKREKYCIMLSNKKAIGDSHVSRLKNTYYMIIDTINKFLRLHTDMTDGEAAMYDMDMDTGKGRVIFQDQKENGFDLDSVKSTWKFAALKEFHITTEKRTDTSAIEHIVVTKHMQIAASDKYDLSAGAIAMRSASTTTISSPSIDINAESKITSETPTYTISTGTFKVSSTGGIDIVAGSATIHISSGGTTISSSGVTINSDNMTISGNGLTINGNLKVSGNITASGTCHAVNI